MNDRFVAGDGLRNYPIRPQEAHRIAEWSRFGAIVLIMTVMSLTMIPPGPALAKDQTSGTDSSEDTGMQVASWLLTVPYCAGKSAFAIAGSVVGSLGYAFSGGKRRNGTGHLDQNRLWDLHSPTSPSQRRRTDPFFRQG